MYYLYFFSIKLLSYIPFCLLYVLSDLLFYPLYYVVRYRRKVVRKNLLESFPDKSLNEIKQIEKRFYHFFVDMALEACKLLTASPDEMRRRARFINNELCNEIMHDGRSVSVFIGHYGNWEWISTYGLWLDPNSECLQIYHKLRNKAMNRVMLKMRERFGDECVDMYDTVRTILSRVKEGRTMAIGFIADQSPKFREVKDFLHFLNHDVPVLTGTEKLTKRFGFGAVYLRTRRVKRGYYEFEFVPLHDSPSSLPDYQLTELYFQNLEQDIRRQPELFLWSHNRFKHARA